MQHTLWIACVFVNREPFIIYFYSMFFLSSSSFAFLFCSCAEFNTRCSYYLFIYFFVFFFQLVVHFRDTISTVGKLFFLCLCRSASGIQHNDTSSQIVTLRHKESKKKEERKSIDFLNTIHSIRDDMSFFNRTNTIVSMFFYFLVVYVLCALQRSIYFTLSIHTLHLQLACSQYQ